MVTNLLNGCTATESIFISQNINEPEADIAVANNLTCETTSIELDGSGSSTGADFEYLWTTTDGNILMGNNTLAPTINDAGTYILQVTNTTNNCISTAEITVNENMTTPIADAGAQGLLTCAITETTLNGSNSSTGNDIIYEWTTVNGNIISGANTISPTVGNTGTYELIVTNTTTGCTASAFVEVGSDGNIPNATASPDGILTCGETEITLNGNGSSAGNNFEYQWTTTNGNIISGDTTISPMVDQVGAYTLLVTNTDNGCSNEVTIFVEDDLAQPSALIDQTGNLTLDCVTSSLVIDGSASQPFGNLAYAWTTFDGNIISGANTPNPEIDDDGTYTLTITNLTNGCTATEAIVISQSLDVPQVNIAPPLVLTCDLEETILDASNSSVGNYTYLWTTTNGNIISGANTLTPTVNQNGSYQLVITDLSNNCENESTIVVLENTTPPIAEAGTADILNCQNVSVTLNGSGSSSGNNITYEWTTDGNIISNTIS
ncbi:MAG TPA: hypothetical protein ENJ53_00475, partial [Phaeodactylibacter sp.]|nr:hypothetical protein [Phaeodactylibacter sp.]